MSLRLILHGRNICAARRPKCDECAVAGLCPSAGIGTVAPRKKRASPG